MGSNNSKKIWQTPMLLTILTLFGLLAALLGEGIWHLLSWIAMLIPLVVVIWFWFIRKSTVGKSGKA